jgi:hypothetical protein
MNGRENIEALCPAVEALVKRSEIMAMYRARKGQGT